MFLKKIFIIVLSIILIIPCSGCKEKSTSKDQFETLIGTYGADIGETMISDMYVDDNEKIYVSYVEDMGEKYVYNVTDNKKTTKNYEDLKSSANKVIDNMTVSLSPSGAYVVVKDNSNGAILNKIPTNLNEDSIPNDVYFNLSSQIAIDVYGNYIYMVNENGIFRAMYDEIEFSQIIDSADTTYLEYENSENTLDEEFQNSEYISYGIVVLSNSRFYVSVRVSDSFGYSYTINYIEYNTAYETDSITTINTDNIVTEYDAGILDEVVSDNSIDALNTQATHVFKAKVIENNEYVQNGFVYTEARCRVTEVFKGDAETGEYVDLVTLGGIISAKDYLSENYESSTAELCENSSIPEEQQLLKFNYFHPFTLTEGDEYLFFTLYEAYRGKYKYFMISGLDSVFSIEGNTLKRLSDYSPVTIDSQEFLDLY